MTSHTFKGLKTETHEDRTIHETTCHCGITKRTIHFKGEPKPVTRYFRDSKMITDIRNAECVPVAAPPAGEISATDNIVMQQGNYTLVEARLLEAFVIMRSMLADLTNYGVDLDGHSSLRMAKTFVKAEAIIFQ